MDTTPLVMDEIDAGAEFLKRLDAFKPIVAACWMREAENEERYLYAALDGLAVDNSDIAYGEVRRIAGQMKDRYVDPFRVKLIGPAHPVAKAILDIYRRYPAPIPTNFGGQVFGSMAVAEVYVYPPLKRTP